MSGDFDNAVRLALYSEFVRTASAPAAADLATQMQCPEADVRAALERLAAGKAVVLEPDSREILMANPLCAVPTPYRVRAQGRSFFGVASAGSMEPFGAVSDRRGAGGAADAHRRADESPSMKDSRERG